MSEDKAKELLNIDKNLELDDNVLTKAYRIAAMENHPDVNKDRGREKMQEINEARATLKKVIDSPNYEEYVKNKLGELRNKYLGNKKIRINVYDSVNERIKRFYDKVLNYNDISKFNKEYDLLEKGIIESIKRYKEVNINILRNDFVVNADTNNKVEKLYSLISNEYNIDSLELIFFNAKKELKKYNNNESFVNKYFLEAKRAYLYNRYIDNINYDKINYEDELFNNEKKKIKTSIDNFINRFSDKDSINLFKLLFHNLEGSIINEKELFIENIIDNSVNKKLLKEYSFASNQVSKIKKDLKKFSNLTLIYNYSNRIPIIISDAIRNNIVIRLDKIINNEEYKKIKYYDKVKDLINAKYKNIVESINIDVNSDNIINYELELTNEILKLISKYGKMDIERNRLLEQAGMYGINNGIINNLVKASELDELERCIMDARNFIDNYKNNKNNINDNIERQRIISSIKGILNLRLVSCSYNDNNKKIIVDKVKDILDKYRDNKIEDISFLKNIYFIDFDKDYLVVNSFNTKNNKKESKYVDDDFDVIEEIFENRDSKNRKDYADKIYAKLINRYNESRSNSDSYQKKEVLYKVINILKDYVNYNIDDVSELNNIMFYNYDKDLNIIYNIYNKNNGNNYYKGR